MIVRTLIGSTVVALLLTSSAAAQQKHDTHEQHEHTDGLAASETPVAQEVNEESDERSPGPHGGELHPIGDLQAEAVVEPDGMRLFVYDKNSKPIDLRAARGLATLQVEGNAKRYRYDLFPEFRKDQEVEALAVAVDLRRIAGQSVEIRFQLVGIPGAERRPATFNTSTVAPMTREQRVAADIATQKVCPVSGHPLGSMGDPISVTLGKRTVYVCCKGCVAAVQADPAKYLAKVNRSAGVVPSGSEQVRPGVYKVTRADQPFITVQQTCPVMDEPLDAMGGPFKVHAEGKAIYICCPGCAKKIIAAPTKYLQVLAEQGVIAPTLLQEIASQVASAEGEEVRPGIFKVVATDRSYVNAQKVCPVMDEPLDAMGGPYKTVVEGRVVYLCCPGCAKKLHANPGIYFAKLSKQGVTPPEAP